MYKVKKPLQLKIDGAFRSFKVGQSIAEDLIVDKTAKSLLNDGFIENFVNEKAVFHNERKVKLADNFKRDIDEEYKELRNVPDLKILDKPRIQIIEEESREEVLKIPDITEKNVAVKKSQKDKKVKPMVVEETYQEEAKIADIVDRNKGLENAVKTEDTNNEDKVEGPLNTAISDEIKGVVEENTSKGVVSKKKNTKRRVRTKKKVG